MLLTSSKESLVHHPFAEQHVELQEDDGHGHDDVDDMLSTSSRKSLVYRPFAGQYIVQLKVDNGHYQLS